MSQIEFEHECSRAQLLGIEPPTWDEFCAQQLAKKGENEGEEDEPRDPDEIDAGTAEALNDQGENLKRNIGGLDELNSILANTQHKINKFKSVCGSFTNLMKLRNWKSEAAESGGTSSVPATPNHRKENDLADSAMASEVATQVDRLDSLIGKAERAELSMSSQNKQMKSYLRK